MRRNNHMPNDYPIVTPYYMPIRSQRAARAAVNYVYQNNRDFIAETAAGTAAGGFAGLPAGPAGVATGAFVGGGAAAISYIVRDAIKKKD